MAFWKFLGCVGCMVAGISPANAQKDDNTILGAAQVNLAASSEIEVFVCAFNEEGGMISSIVDASLKASGQIQSADWDFVRNPLDIDLTKASQSDRVVFPMYKPRCDESGLLTEHTKSLCNDFVWSDPLFHVITTGYVSARSEWMPKSNTDLIGRTICQPKGEVSLFLRQRGLTDFNARLVVAATPSACLEQVAAGESDVAVLPMISADEALEDEALAGAIRHAAGLDTVLSVHAIAGRDAEAAKAKVDALDLGLEEIRASGAWFEIVKGHIGGHTHEHRHVSNSSYDH